MTTHSEYLIYVGDHWKWWVSHLKLKYRGFSGCVELKHHGFLLSIAHHNIELGTEVWDSKRENGDINYYLEKGWLNAYNIIEYFY